MSRYKKTWAKDELLADMEHSIQRAMEDKLTDLTGALLRLNAAARGWCEIHDCGPCPLAVMACQDGIDERVNKLIKAYHADKHKKALKPKIEKTEHSETPEQTGQNQTARL